MKLEVCHLKQSQPLTEDYVSHYTTVQPLFDYNPWDAEAWESRVQWLDDPRHEQADRLKLVELLQDYNQAIHNAPGAMDNIASLRDGQTLAAVGGQQAGLFTGPLYVIHKAVTLIQTAKEASIRLGRTVVPVFWIAGEDHDLDEVNHTYYLHPNLHVQKIKLGHATEFRVSVSQLLVSLEAWEDALKQLDESLAETEFKPDLMKKLHQFSLECATLVDFFGCIMAWLFGSYGLVLVNSDDPMLRQIEAPLFRKMILENERINEALLEGRNKVEGLKFEPQAEVGESNANLFIFHQGERLLLQRESGSFVNKKKNLFFSEIELLKMAEESPQSFSNNVVTRPMMQEFVFPVLCTVLGPGEIAYWGLTREAFHLLGMRMPVIVPRLQFTLVEGGIEKQMQKFGLVFADVVNAYGQKKKAWLDEQDTLQLEQRFAEVKEQFTEMYRPLLELVSGINPGIGKLGETNIQKILEQIDFLQVRSTDAFQSRFEVALKQLERIRLSIIPLDKPQERVYNIFAYLNKYGRAWLDELLNEPIVIDGQHRIVNL
ncbi:MAG TPA: bacillithiol biosynthesis cysteine-adding enzyme BshC [Bacilli bacterium]